ncbi:MAG: stability/partitioning determinant [Pseudomonadota bacterium]
MTKERQSLFSDELNNLDPNAWVPPESKVSNDRKPTPETKQVAEEAGFQSRPTAGQGSAPKKQRRRRTGRNAQFNIKTTPEAIEEFTAIADALDWGLGETFEKAIPLLKAEFIDKPQK